MSVRQLSLGLDLPPLSKPSELVRSAFSHNDVSPQNARLALEERYMPLFEETNEFDRQTVSYQGNKGEVLHSWFKYREGFSAELVEAFIRKFELGSGCTILEPFSGSATTLLVARMMGINAVGVEILPVCHLAWEAKSHTYDLVELRRVYEWITQNEPGQASSRFPHLVITETAFSEKKENDLMFYTEWVRALDVSERTKTLLRLVLVSILEEISYTRKDGQFLRWDRRSGKIRRRNRKRKEKGKKLIKGMHKGELPGVKEALVGALHAIIEDIEVLQEHPLPEGQQRLIRGSALEVLPTLDAGRFDAVITSPPYCNRYDYTRTYALELAYLEIGEDGIRQLRQEQLSCTVEHRSKIDRIEDLYTSLDQRDRFERVLETVRSNAAFQEVNVALQTRWNRGEINNSGILPMVEGYFTEMAFVFAEILRVCRPGAHVVFVNDNVRYGGEVIPVDLLTTDLAAQLGFEPMKVYVLPQRKGNSSQQMGRFGREALRKSITVWKKDK